MTQTGYSNAIVNAMLGWLKGLASWVLRLFNLSGGFSPLKFLANHWLKLLIFFLVIGVATDLLVWLIRWRPHWVWFRKKRVIINDKNFFAREKYIDDSDDWDLPSERRRPEDNRARRPRRNWEDSEFVVPGAQRRRREEAASRRAAHVKSMQLNRQENAEDTDVFRDGLFNVKAKQKFSNRYEDEVFSVSNLPKPAHDAGGAQNRRAPAAPRNQTRSKDAQRKSMPRRDANKRDVYRKTNNRKTRTR